MARGERLLRRLWIDRPVLVFAVLGLIGALLVGAVAAYGVRRNGDEEAIRDARRVAHMAGTGIVEPMLSPAVLAGDPAALAELDRVVRARVLGDVSRVKVWAGDGRIVYSDEPRLIGGRYVLEEGMLVALARGEPKAEIARLEGAENAYESGRLLEVYSPVVAQDGTPLLFEAYIPFDRIVESGSSIWRSFVPIVVVGILALYLLMLPLVWSLSRRLNRAHAQREGLLMRALEAGERERRRIASDLHDGVVQDLAGLSFELEAAARGPVGDVDDAEQRARLRGAARRVRGSVRDLRTLLVEIYPPNLRRAGLAQAVTDLAASLEPRAVVTAVEIPELPGLAEEHEALAFRVAQEGLRNAYRHARASRVTVRLDRDHAGRPVLTVEDDGIGVDPGALVDRRRDGHLGLTALGDLVRDAGGRLELQTAQDRGTRLRLELPA